MKKILLATLLLLGGCARAVNPISESIQRPEEMDIDPTVEQGVFTDILLLHTSKVRLT